MTARQLHDLADALLDPSVEDVEACVRFVMMETRGHWHGRARAMMCRRLKHCRIDEPLRTQLIDCILTRLREGNFSEQFRDQLRLAIRLDARSALFAARDVITSRKQHVRRYAQWVADRCADRLGEQSAIL